MRNDPEGFEKMRAKMFSSFPKLQYVASQSFGAQTGGGLDGKGAYGPVYDVNRYSMSKAFLATEHFDDKESISARMTHAIYTGHHRFACKAIFDFMSDPKEAAAGSNGPPAAIERNTAHGQTDFDGRYDRNYLLYMAIIYTESLNEQTGSNEVPDAFGVWKKHCEDPSGFRAPMPTQRWRQDPKRYTMNEDLLGRVVSAHDIGPIFTFGSLRQIRDEWGATWASSQKERGCSKAEYDEDATVDFHYQARCVPDTTQETFFESEMAIKRKNTISNMFRNRICNPAYTYTIESAIGNPYRWKEQLQDASTLKQVKRYEEDNRVYGYNQAVDMFVPTQMRTDSNFDGTSPNEDDAGDPSKTPTFRESSLIQWVYVTSSDEPDIEPGMHRLIDIQAWPNRECWQNHDQPCLGTSEVSSDPFKSAFRKEQSTPRRRLFFFVFAILAALAAANAAADALSNAFGETFSGSGGNDYGIVRSNPPTGTPEQSKSWTGGRKALFRARCSDVLSSAKPAIFGVMACTGNERIFQHYEGFPQCTGAARVVSGTVSAKTLELANRPQNAPLSSYISRFGFLSPPPSRPPSPPPPEPPSPPMPSPPPSPPDTLSMDQIKGVVNVVERRFCNSVYILSAEARCKNLAVEMNVRYGLDATWSPPSLPPLAPDVLPPPPPPPNPYPALPKGTAHYVRFEGVTLSTYFFPGIAEDTASLPFIGTANDIILEAPSFFREKISKTMRSEPLSEWAACSYEQRDAALPCRTGALPERCVDGGRRCGTVEQNTAFPWMEIQLDDEHHRVDNSYLWAIEFTLPDSEEFAPMLFQQANDVGLEGDTGYTVIVYDDTHTPLKTQCKTLGEQQSPRYVVGKRRHQHLCLRGTDDDAAYVELTRARYVRIVLTGQLRQFWLNDVKIVFHKLLALENPIPPPSPRPPPAPPQPIAPPDAPPAALDNCVFNAHRSYSAQRLTWIADEPCGLDPIQCCVAAASANGSNAFRLSDAGCCTAYYVKGNLTHMEFDAVGYGFGAILGNL